jgi:hypothetical protein
VHTLQSPIRLSHDSVDDDIILAAYVSRKEGQDAIGGSVVQTCGDPDQASRRSIEYTTAGSAGTKKLCAVSTSPSTAAIGAASQSPTSPMTSAAATCTLKASSPISPSSPTLPISLKLPRFLQSRLTVAA